MATVTVKTQPVYGLPLGGGHVKFTTPYDDPFNTATVQSWWTQTGLVVTPLAGGPASVSTPNQHDRLTMTSAYVSGLTVWSLRIHMGYLSTGAGMFGLVCADSSGNGVGFSAYNDGNAYLWNVSAWGYTSTGPSIGGGGTLTVNQPDSWFELRQSAASTWLGRVANTPDPSTSWSAYSASLSSTFTPAYIGLAHIWTSTATTAKLKEWIIVKS